jgi:hypothetical protein
MWPASASLMASPTRAKRRHPLLPMDDMNKEIPELIGVTGGLRGATGVALSRQSRKTSAGRGRVGALGSEREKPRGEARQLGR